MHRPRPVGAHVGKGGGQVNEPGPRQAGVKFRPNHINGRPQIDHAAWHNPRLDPRFMLGPGDLVEHAGSMPTRTWGWFTSVMWFGQISHQPGVAEPARQGGMGQTHLELHRQLPVKCASQWLHRLSDGSAPTCTWP
jgi:hypothetical protein